MISLSNVFKISHYTQQSEKRLIEAKEIKPMPLFANFDEMNENEQDNLTSQSQDHVQLQAMELLEQTHKEIAELKLQAQNEIVEWRKTEERSIEDERERQFKLAQQFGYEEGYRQGLHEGTLEAHNQYKEAIDYANSIIKQAEADWKRRVAESEPFLINLSIEIAKKVILRELQLDKQTVTQMVKETLKLSSELKEITILVHSDDYPMLRSHMDELQLLVSSQANIILLPDHSITSGGCMIRTSLGTLDARVDTQLAEIREALMEAIKGSEVDEIEPIREI